MLRIFKSGGQRIKKYRHCFVEGNPVFALVERSLLGIPLEPHRAILHSDGFFRLTSARDKLHLDSRQGQCFCVPVETKGPKRSGVATKGSEVSFVEQIGGARTGTLPSSERAVCYWSLPFTS